MLQILEAPPPVESHNSVEKLVEFELLSCSYVKIETERQDCIKKKELRQRFPNCELRLNFFGGHI